MHDAEVQSSQIIVLCVREGAMNEAEVKFTQRWNDFLEQYMGTAWRIDGEKNQFVFDIFLGKKANEIVNETGEWSMRRWTKHLNPEAYPQRVLCMRIMNGIPISSQEPKGGKEPFLQDAE